MHEEGVRAYERNEGYCGVMNGKPRRQQNKMREPNEKHREPV